MAPMLVKVEGEKFKVVPYTESEYLLVAASPALEQLLSTPMDFDIAMNRFKLLRDTAIQLRLPGNGHN